MIKDKVLNRHTTNNSTVDYWTFMDIDTLNAWFDGKDASTVTISGGKITQWSDKSGNERHSVQATSTKQPTYDAENGKVVFSGSQFMDMTATSNDIAKNIGELNIFALVKYDLTANQCLFAASVSSSISAARIRLGQGYTHSKIGTGGRKADTDSFLYVNSLNTSTALIIQHGQAIYTSSDCYQYINGVLDGSKNDFFTDGNTDNTASMSVGFGGANANSYRMTGNIHQLIITGTITGSERQKIEGYLAHYTGNVALLPAGHPYKTTPPTK